MQARSYLRTFRWWIRLLELESHGRQFGAHCVHVVSDQYSTLRYLALTSHSALSLSIVIHSAQPVLSLSRTHTTGLCVKQSTHKTRHKDYIDVRYERLGS